ncbi:hypothetical protein C8Q75DRAFT_785527 [Abortiporus biennis]|nr:hypothetical protein C8Q75DRAFT_785527 [Abortiporus biennis]
MTSLLDRISTPDSVGPVRNKNRSGGTSPYNRPQRVPKGDVDGAWEHDLYRDSDSRSLVSRLSNTKTSPKINLSAAERALREARGEKGLSIKGASGRGNVVQVSGLAKGTTAEDVAAIFKRCGQITSQIVTARGDRGESVVVRLTFKEEKDAQSAVEKFHGQPADGRILNVKIVGGVDVSLSGRLGVIAHDGSVDALIEDGPSKGGSKLRSDEILAKDSRATVLVAPPGTNPADYIQRPQRGGRGRGRGRGGRRGGGGGGNRMDID